MQARTKVAAAAASVIPFHCIICFDEFSASERPPVVLPCGHTFVCQPCSKRLNRCMECREPLFLPAPVATAPKQQARIQPAPAMYARGRMPSPPVTPTPPPPTASPSAPIALPMPKNVVLLALMEAADRQQRVIHRNDTDSTASDTSSLEDDDMEEYDLNRIISGMATLSGPCGTYAVKEKAGLAILSTDPRKRELLQETAQTQEPSTLRLGQTVQVVNVEAGIATLARKRGYVVANSSQLVKIGGPLDEACRLEGLLNTVVERGDDLRKELQQSDNVCNGLRSQIEAALEREATHPVITEALDLEDNLTLSKIADKVPSTPPSHISSSKHDLTPPMLRTAESPTTASPFNIERRNFEVDENGIRICPSPTPISPKSIDNADLVPIYRRSRSISVDDINVAFSCGATLAADECNLSDARSNQVATRDSSFDSLMHAAPTLTSSFDSVDFRTGLSGHRALTTAKRTNRDSSGQRAQRLMMSDHRGIGRTWPIFRRDSPSSSPLTAPKDVY